jgi:hypothetical protein
MIKVFAAATILSIFLFTPVSAGPLDYLCKQCSSASIVTDGSEKQQVVAELQKIFVDRVGAGQIKECTLLIQENFGQGFSALGALCDVTRANKTSQWMICNDNGVGNFAAVTGARWWQDPKLFLTQFTDENCVGG